MRETLEPASTANAEQPERGGRRPPKGSWKFLAEPKWVAGHVIVVVATIAFLLLGLWQVDRNDEKHARDRAAKAEFAAAAPAIGASGTEPAAGERVEASGIYDADTELLLRNRVRDGEGGYELLTPLVLDDGTAIVVDRGWVPRNDVDRNADSLTAPTGRVTVRGPIGASRPLNADDTTDEAAGRTTLPRIDLDRIRAETNVELRDVFITAQYQDPAPIDGIPALPTPPPSDSVNHLQYAFQWFAFALIPVIGWPIVLYRRSRRPR